MAQAMANKQWPDRPTARPTAWLPTVRQLEYQIRPDARNPAKVWPISIQNTNKYIYIYIYIKINAIHDVALLYNI